jgi:hypothetical protein
MLIRSSDVRDHLLLDHETVGEGVGGQAGESADSDLWGWVIFLQGCLVVIKPEEARSHRMSAVDHSCSGNDATAR